MDPETILSMADGSAEWWLDPDVVWVITREHLAASTLRRLDEPRV